MLARFSAFATWAVVAASLMYWLLRLFAGTSTAPDYTVAVDQAQRGDLARVFGASAAPAPTAVAATPVAPPPPATSSRFKLVGVAAPKDAKAGFGLALISVDGKPPRAVGVGRPVDEGWVLESVGRRTARLSNGGTETVDLDIPPLALATRGVPGVTPPSPTPGGAVPPGSVRPPIAFPVPGSPAATNPGGPPPVFVPQEEMSRRNRATGASED